MDESTFELLFTRQLRMREKDEWYKVPMNSYLFYDSSAIGASLAESEQLRKAESMQRIQVEVSFIATIKKYKRVRSRRNDSLYHRAYSIEYNRRN